MSITVQGITKLYGTQKALNEVSFSVGSGEVVGFLGPNGAGKSTMMKILTCFLPPTHGTATVCGFDTGKDSLKVRRHVGYLPEHNPLYLDLYVKEYLDLVAGLHGMRNRAPRVKEMIELVGLGPEQHKRIGMLSKGYRQRVGLAQAMIHDPEVLILDEPTSGLDPNQLVDVRALIKRMGQNKAIIFSTHILEEVEAACSRAIIIDRGKVVADGTPAQLKQRGDAAVRVALRGAVAGLADELGKISGVSRVEAGTSEAQIFAGRVFAGKGRQPVDIAREISSLAQARGLQIEELHQEEGKLDEVFRSITRSDLAA